ncbi:hypothetical protein BVRB_035320 [Beta vulgaris subsp. vulgaris]|uniref:Uncharacterized protein n=1 Tax=Beta vulgaris subsp. vulgaris TaxID=3555 RepID=A0A0J8BIM3_BETVV|nr:hypothetical protein BVRB_035320 [Beta vulgaris subsp. vulgaris]
MDKDTLKDFAIYALSPEDRLAKMNATAKKPLKESSLTEFYSNPLRVYGYATADCCTCSYTMLIAIATLVCLESVLK